MSKQDYTDNYPLITAADNGDLIKVLQLLKNNANVNASDQNNHTALDVAFWQFQNSFNPAYLFIIGLLAKYGAAVVNDSYTQYQNQNLQQAIDNGRKAYERFENIAVLFPQITVSYHEKLMNALYWEYLEQDHSDTVKKKHSPQ